MKKIDYGSGEIEYDELAPCIICGEPVLAASMGGTVVCPFCDLGRCRFCRISIFVDGEKSKKEVLSHMKWHREQLGLKEKYTEKELYEAKKNDKTKRTNRRRIFE